MIEDTTPNGGEMSDSECGVRVPEDVRAQGTKGLDACREWRRGGRRLSFDELDVIIDALAWLDGLPAQPAAMPERTVRARMKDLLDADDELFKADMVEAVEWLREYTLLSSQQQPDADRVLAVIAGEKQGA